MDYSPMDVDGPEYYLPAATTSPECSREPASTAVPIVPEPIVPEPTATSAFWLTDTARATPTLGATPMFTSTPLVRYSQQTLKFAPLPKFSPIPSPSPLKRKFLEREDSLVPEMRFLNKGPRNASGTDRPVFDLSARISRNPFIVDPRSKVRPVLAPKPLVTKLVIDRVNRVPLFGPRTCNPSAVVSAPASASDANAHTVQAPAPELLVQPRRIPMSERVGTAVLHVVSRLAARAMRKVAIQMLAVSTDASDRKRRCVSHCDEDPFASKLRRMPGAFPSTPKRVPYPRITIKDRRSVTTLKAQARSLPIEAVDFRPPTPARATPKAEADRRFRVVQPPLFSPVIEGTLEPSSTALSPPAIAATHDQQASAGEIEPKVITKTSPIRNGARPSQKPAGGLQAQHTSARITKSQNTTRQQHLDRPHVVTRVIGGISRYFMRNPTTASNVPGWFSHIMGFRTPADTESQSSVPQESATIQDTVAPAATMPSSQQNNPAAEPLKAVVPPEAATASGQAKHPPVKLPQSLKSWTTQSKQGIPTPPLSRPTTASSVPVESSTLTDASKPAKASKQFKVSKQIKTSKRTTTSIQTEASKQVQPSEPSMPPPDERFQVHHETSWVSFNLNPTPVENRKPELWSFANEEWELAAREKWRKENDEDEACANKKKLFEPYYKKQHREAEQRYRERQKQWEKEDKERKEQRKQELKSKFSQGSLTAEERWQQKEADIDALILKCKQVAMTTAKELETKIAKLESELEEESKLPPPSPWFRSQVILPKIEDLEDLKCDAEWESNRQVNRLAGWDYRRKVTAIEFQQQEKKDLAEWKNLVNEEAAELAAKQNEGTADFEAKQKQAAAELEMKQGEDAAAAEARKQHIIGPLSSECSRRLDTMLDTIDDPHQKVAVSAGGFALTRSMFGRILASPCNGKGNGSGVESWLDDDAINAWLDAICLRKREQVGWKKGDKTAPPFVTYNSAWYESQKVSGIKAIGGWSRRKGIQGGKLLEAEKIFFPVNSGAHWTLLIISPKDRSIEYLDSLSSTAGKHEMKLARAWLEMELGEKYKANDWSELRSKSQMQSNNDDCGVFTCFNALAAARGAHYREIRAAKMPEARRMMAAVFLNGGFTDDFEL